MPMGETIKTCVFWLTTASCISGLSQIRECNAMKCEGMLLTFVFCMLVIYRGYLEECKCVVVTKNITQEIAENACIGRWHWVVGARRALKAAFRFMVRVSRFISLFLLTFKIFLGLQHIRRCPNHLKLHHWTNYPATKMDKDQYRLFLVLDLENGAFRFRMDISERIEQPKFQCWVAAAGEGSVVLIHFGAWILRFPSVL